MSFDYNKEIEILEYPQTFKAGLIYYMNINKLEPKNKKEFNKILDDYKELKL